MASLPRCLGPPDWRRADRLRSRRAVLDLSARGCDGGSSHDKPVYASRLGSRDSGSPDHPAAVDGILHLMGDRVCRRGSSPKYRTEAAYQSAPVTTELY